MICSQSVDETQQTHADSVRNGHQSLAACDRFAKVDLCMLNLSTCYLVHSWASRVPKIQLTTGQKTERKPTLKPKDFQRLRHWFGQWLAIVWCQTPNVSIISAMRWCPGEPRPAVANLVATLPSGLGPKRLGYAWDVSSWIFYTWWCPMVLYIDDL